MNINKQDGRFSFGNLGSIQNAGEKIPRKYEMSNCRTRVFNAVQGDFSQLFHAYTLMFIWIERVIKINVKYIFRTVGFFLSLIKIIKNLMYNV